MEVVNMTPHRVTRSASGRRVMFSAEDEVFEISPRKPLYESAHEAIAERKRQQEDMEENMHEIYALERHYLQLCRLPPNDSRAETKEQVIREIEDLRARKQILEESMEGMNAILRTFPREQLLAAMKSEMAAQRSEADAAQSTQEEKSEEGNDHKPYVTIPAPHGDELDYDVERDYLEEDEEDVEISASEFEDPYQEGGPVGGPTLQEGERLALHVQRLYRGSKGRLKAKAVMREKERRDLQEQMKKRREEQKRKEEEEALLKQEEEKERVRQMALKLEAEQKEREEAERRRREQMRREGEERERRRRLEKEKKEKEKKQRELEKKAEEEREKKQREEERRKREKERQAREEEKKKREEKEREEQRIREEKERRRKEAERKKREEERKKREEERRQREEQKKAAEEEAARKAKAEEEARKAAEEARRNELAARKREADARREKEKEEEAKKKAEAAAQEATKAPVKPSGQPDMRRPLGVRTTNGTPAPPLERTSSPRLASIRGLPSPRQSYVNPPAPPENSKPRAQPMKAWGSSSEGKENVSSNTMPAHRPVIANRKTTVPPPPVPESAKSGDGSVTGGRVFLKSDSWKSRFENQVKEASKSNDKLVESATKGDAEKKVLGNATNSSKEGEGDHAKKASIDSTHSEDISKGRTVSSSVDASVRGRTRPGSAPASRSVSVDQTTKASSEGSVETRGRNEGKVGQSRRMSVEEVNAFVQRQLQKSREKEEKIRQMQAKSGIPKRSTKEQLEAFIKRQENRMKEKDKKLSQKFSHYKEEKPKKIKNRKMQRESIASFLSRMEDDLRRRQTHKKKLAELSDTGLIEDPDVKSSLLRPRSADRTKPNRDSTGAVGEESGSEVPKKVERKRLLRQRNKKRKVTRDH